MRHSVLSRFKGTLLGVVLGEKTASSNHQLQGAEKLERTSLHWSHMAVLCAESLISLGRLDTEDWRKRQQQDFKNLENSYWAIVGTLPVALFFHENTIKLRDNLLLTAKIWQDEPVVRDGILAVGYAIAQSLTEKLTPATLITQTISFIGETPTNLPENLLKVKNLIECGASLEKVQAEVIKEEKLSYTIALAFYCFLSHIEDFRLSVLRATQLHHCSQAVAALVGALSGAYNSTVGIPVTWQITLLQANSSAEKETGSRMVQLADALVGVWSGVYNLALDQDEVSEKGGAIAPHQVHLQATAAPRVIRAR